MGNVIPYHYQFAIQALQPNLSAYHLILILTEQYFLELKMELDAVVSVFTSCRVHWQLVLTFLCLYLVSLGARSLYARSSLPLPPGPSRLPLIGNLHPAPSQYPWLMYQKWHKIYVPIISVKYGQRTVIVLGSHKAAADLLRKRSRNYSSCPHMIVAGDSITRNNLLALMPYGERWRTHRQILTFFLSTEDRKSVV